MQEKEQGFSRAVATSTGFAIITDRKRIVTARWGDPSALARGAGPVQGLHQPAQNQRLPVDPHHRFGRDGKRVEVQIRTRQMHDVAEPVLRRIGPIVTACARKPVCG